MNFTNSIQVVDSHTVGQDTRIVVGGLPVLRGNSMMEKKKYFHDHFDNVRKLLMHEPRGHANMFGAVLTDPTNDKADYGIIFIDGAGYLNMCGHGTIGVATVLVELNMVKVTEPVTKLILETPAGLIHVDVKVKDHRAVNVSFKNVPSFLYKENVEVNLPNYGSVHCDISFGGNFFAIVKDSELNVDIKPENIKEITTKALELLHCVNEQVKVKHPLLNINSVDLVEIYGKSRDEDADQQNVVVLGHGEVDRSPCGTGTSAKIATLVAKGKLAMNTPFVYESILRTKFIGKAIKKVKVKNYDAVIPQITGSAYITGFNQLVVDPKDPLRYGFVL